VLSCLKYIQYFKYMQFIHEINIDKPTEKSIIKLRNQSFPDFTIDRSYYKQLPHIRCLQFNKSKLVGYMGLDYRDIAVADSPLRVLGVIDFCVDESQRNQGIGTDMLNELTVFAKSKQVDFIILMADDSRIYLDNGFKHVPNVPSSWLRIHEYKNLGIAFEHLDELYIKPVSQKHWPEGHVDWLGYMF